MTFYEAALRILESEGRPLHFLEITEKSIQQSLLSHVGKTPEVTMLSRLAAMARRTRDRKVIVTAKDTFALVDWSIPEDVEALAQTGVIEPNPEEDLPPLRPAERHPEPRTDNVRAAGRGSERKRRRDEDEERGGKRKRFPPLPEVVFEILSDAEAGLRTEVIIERARSKELCAEDLTVEAVLTALLEDNQRRIDAGRRPQYAFNKDSGEVTLERAGSPSEAPSLELQAAFAQALGIPLEAGRPVLARTAATAVAGEPVVDAALLATLRTSLKDARRAVARGLRKRLGEADVGTFEKSVVKMMHGLGFRELKVAKRSKEGPLLTARKREGSVELRYAVRMLKGAPAIDRKSVQELRRDLSHYSAQVGLLVSAGDVRGDARTEAQASGSLVMLWCGDALGEKFLEAETAVTVTRVELYEVDERFFEAAKLDAEEAQKRREERQREKQKGEDESPEVAAAAASSERPERPERPPREKRRRERDRDKREARSGDEVEVSSEGAEARAGGESASEARESFPAAPVSPPQSSGSEDDEGEDGDDDEDDDLEAASAFVGARPEGGAAEGGDAAQGDRKRRRRRRRGRRGRGNRATEGGAAAPGEAGAAPSGEGAAAAPGEAGALPSGEGATATPSEAGAAPSSEGATPSGEAGATSQGEASAAPSGDADGAPVSTSESGAPALPPEVAESTDERRAAPVAEAAPTESHQDIAPPPPATESTQAGEAHEVREAAPPSTRSPSEGGEG
ncbi:HTH domain-containing protein [Myxococcus qinghaiensis]|uniref:HTH domain-containing protein n=1 Tax=Myxococcus qinghaiensis TaxID=2906758 RepID=UPI0020A730A1|nr:restriction endonuclease [Myxococcus qinghaiensis]MCP3164151.1 HTH domain-containing protein [Myxococcus qinghaiensis]